MSLLVFALPGNEALAAELARRLGSEPGRLSVRRFPDGESHLRFETPVSGREIALACTLRDPDAKVPPLLFAAETARELGARRVGLVAPYLAYMRQDKRFQEGEGVTSAHFAKLVSRYFDWLVTVDPHLHRRSSLDEIYDIPSRVVHAAPVIAAWIGKAVESPILIGPDAESAQWVSEVARGAGAPWTVLEKTRRGDRDVSVSVPDAGRLRGRTPVLVDDIVSTARTMIAAAAQLARLGAARPVCVGVHAVFAGDAHAALLAAGIASIATSNTIPHPTNAIDVVPAVADALAAAGP